MHKQENEVKMYNLPVNFNVVAVPINMQ